MKALVTGCAGFIGSNLVDRLLSDGYDVTGIDCFTDYYDKKLKYANISHALGHSGFHLVEKDIMEMDSFPETDYVFHMAAQAGVRASWGQTFMTYTRNNINITQRLLEHFKGKQIKKFVYSSSSSVYGDVELPMVETSILRPVSPYGVTKLAAENLCYLYWKNFGVPTVSLRYFTVYGPRQRPDMGINKFVRAIFNDDPITIYGDGAQTRDFTYIRDVVEANVLSATTTITGENFNIGGGSRISVKDLVRQIEHYAGTTAKIVFAEKQKGDADDTWADIAKANNVLGWEPKVSIDLGLREYISWYKHTMLKV